MANASGNLGKSFVDSCARCDEEEGLEPFRTDGGQVVDLCTRCMVRAYQEDTSNNMGMPMTSTPGPSARTISFGELGTHTTVSSVPVDRRKKAGH